jgi:hypothetical protein
MNKYFEYLIKLRDSGVTNMWGAPEYLAEEFSLSFIEAKNICQEWMRSLRR